MAPTKNIAILGSTGSIGTSALEVIARYPDRLRATCLTAHRNIDLLRDQVNRFRPRAVVVHDEESAKRLRSLLDSSTRVMAGEEGLREAVSGDDVDMVLCSLVGFAGLTPTYWAIQAGKDIALANKEALVVGGGLIMGEARRKGVRLLPVDSEHSAILQCMQGEDLSSVRRLILTASGGPFLHLDPGAFSAITKEQALSHPTWKMGKKITVDSATLMNKGLEVIEAHWLFGLPGGQIDVVIHPQSVIHSMVEFVDGSIKAQLSVPDMKLPIQYALLYPERPVSPFAELDFARLGQMTFLSPDVERFPCLRLAYRALDAGGAAPAVLNAANEAAVQLFLEDRLHFTAIASVIETALETHTGLQASTLRDLIEVDGEVRRSILHHHVMAG